MKKIITIIISLLVMATSVHAEILLRGVVEEVNLEAGIVKINNSEYKVQEGKTELISGEHSLDLDLLKEGSKVTFTLEGSFIIKMNLVVPYKFES